jgi:hypothetical protein
MGWTRGIRSVDRKGGEVYKNNKNRKKKEGLFEDGRWEKEKKEKLLKVGT